MINRIAFFHGREELQKHFDVQSSSDALYSPHFNISKGQRIPVIDVVDGNRELIRMRWGDTPGNKTAVERDGEQDLKKMFEKSARRVVVPLSGFYVWKENREDDHPFFVRMMDNSAMAVAALVFKAYDGESEYCKFIERESNTLIQPMSPKMPLLLKDDYISRWLDPTAKGEKIVEQTKSLFLITDLTVHRVSKKVNDPTNNDEKLIQPIPK